MLTVVRGTLAELDGAEQVRNGGDVSWDAAQRLHLLVGRLALVVDVHDGNAVVALGGRLLDLAMLVGGLLVGRRVRAVTLDLVCGTHIALAGVVVAAQGTGIGTHPWLCLVSALKQDQEMGMSRGEQDQGWAEACLCILAGAHGTTPPRQVSGKRSC